MPKNILMVSDGRIHPPLMGRFWLRYALAGMKDYTFTRVSSMEEILKFDLKSFHGMVLYFHHDEISKDALNAFEAFVAAGGGVLAIHSVTASFKDNDHFTTIIGGKFSGHGPVEAFAMMPVNFNALHEGQLGPMVWTRPYSEGRVCYACPGHRAASMRISAYQQVLTRGLEWAVANHS
jgi:type 1 glutamine amidotransferase